MTRVCTRQETIDSLREHLLALAGEDQSICKLAAERGLFCHGFAQWKFAELKERYPQIVRSRPRIARRELEELAERWQQARQLVTGEPTACDLQPKEKHYQQCRGWDEFDDRQLESFHLEICGEEIEISA